MQKNLTTLSTEAVFVVVRGFPVKLTPTNHIKAHHKQSHKRSPQTIT